MTTTTRISKETIRKLLQEAEKEGRTAYTNYLRRLLESEKSTGERQPRA